MTPLQTLASAALDLAQVLSRAGRVLEAGGDRAGAKKARALARSLRARARKDGGR